MLLSKIVVVASVVTSLATMPVPLANAQSRPPMLGTAMPETGAALEANANSGGAEGGNPVPDGTSFEQFGEIVGALRQNPTAMRGAQEIAAYRKAPPAGVLI